MPASPSSNAPVLTYVNRLLGASLLGGQLVWSVAVLPTYEKLDSDEYLRVHTLLTWYGDALMPSLGLSSTLSGYLRYRKTGEVSALVGAVALTAASIAAARNLRINDRMRDRRASVTGADLVSGAGGDETPDPSEIEHERGMWAAQHLIRSVGGLIAASAYMLPVSARIGAGRPRSGARVGLIDIPLAVILLRSSKEIGGHFAMMRGKGKHAGMARSIGITPVLDDRVEGEPQAGRAA